MGLPASLFTQVRFGIVEPLQGSSMAYSIPGYAARPWALMCYAFGVLTGNALS